MNKYIVLHTLTLDPDDTTDAWEAYDEYEDASARYNQLLQSDDVLTASIALPIVSSDYSTWHYTHDTVIRAYEQFKDAEGSCEDLEDLEELSEYGGTDLPPQEEQLIRAFACIEGLSATGRG
jgi:hypothetical protein